MDRALLAVQSAEGQRLPNFAAHAGRTTERLLRAAEPIWEGYLKHPFVRGLGEGSLNQDRFRFYMLQDYVYLFEYARVFALGAAKAREPESMRIFAAYIHQIMEGEMARHRSYMRRLGIPEKEAEQSRASLDNLSYTSYMLRISYEGGEAELTAAILACALSYEYIARRLLKQYPSSVSHPFYGEWVQGYSSLSYHEENEKLIVLMERLTEQSPEAELSQLAEIFVNCSRFEQSFWDMAWEQRA